MKQIMDESQFFFQSTEQDLKFPDPAYYSLFYWYLMLV